MPNIEDLRDEDGDIVLRVTGTHICAHGKTEYEAWEALHEMIQLVLEDFDKPRRCACP
jgi:predicted RNase H-like HicB family nuclease